ncbi:hypothetical protein KUTeg_006273 [Tegillarca granosa]|uniref:C-type lectin domain-containing protein n=1 Tax=Tegillarca granosa TaxID=220873 RepID=A0ABQ9FG36_TEGGR|nr:hypothetical protein KUTeg_006273 [Tegillarca granosa]
MVQKTFEGLENLRTLELIEFTLQELQNGIFNNLLKLKTLEIRLKSLVRIQSEAFNGIYHCQMLTISGTKITQLHSNTFKRLVNVINLDISHNKLTVLQKELFETMTSLQILDTRGNDIYILERLFDTNMNLKLIYSDTFALCCIKPTHMTAVGCIAPHFDVSSCETLIENDVLCIFLWVIGLLAIVGNMSVLIYRKSIENGLFNETFSVLVWNLTVADTLIGVYLISIGIANEVFRGKYIWMEYRWRNSFLCSALGVLSVLSSEISVLTISFVTVARYFAVKFPFKEHKISRKDAVLWQWLVMICQEQYMHGLWCLFCQLIRQLIRFYILLSIPSLHKQNMLPTIIRFLGRVLKAVSKLLQKTVGIFGIGISIILIVGTLYFIENLLDVLKFHHQLYQEVLKKQHDSERLACLTTSLDLKLNLFEEKSQKENCHQMFSETGIGYCCEDWLDLKKQCFKISSQRRHWYDAEIKCRQHGLLANIKNDNISKLLNSILVTSGKDLSFWIGTNALYKYSGNESIKTEDYKCYSFESSGTYQLVDSACAERKGFICQIDNANRRNQVSAFLCPYGWFQIGKKCFLIDYTFKTWNRANETCHQYDNANLATIDTAEVNDYSIGRFWIGLRYWNGYWRWVKTEEPARYTNWGEGQPQAWIVV